MHDDEYIVLGVENAIQRVIVDGAEVSELMLKNIIIEHKGNQVQVGSGFNHEQRRHFFKNPNEIVGKTVTVQYFETTKNKRGEESLRFPVMKGIYEGIRDY
jgi:DNA ligase-1